MTHYQKCDSFPDIWQDPGDPEDEAIVEANKAHRKVYQAATYILTHDFRPDLLHRIPQEPRDFPGGSGALSENDIAMVVAVHGILIADNWDPSMGKTTPSQGDLPKKVFGMVVDRRFVEATVAAVKEYTSQHDLFDRCFQQLRTEAETTSSSPSPMGSPGRYLAGPAPQANSPASGAPSQANPPATGAPPPAIP